MSGFHFDRDNAPPGNVIPMRRRESTDQGVVYETCDLEAQRFPVDIRGHVTFGRLLSGLSTVGLTVRIDARSGRIVITDESLL
jgi:hypothetical protein